MKGYLCQICYNSQNDLEETIQLIRFSYLLISFLFLSLIILIIFIIPINSFHLIFFNNSFLKFWFIFLETSNLYWHFLNSQKEKKHE